MLAFSVSVVSLLLIRTYRSDKKAVFHPIFHELLLMKHPQCAVGIYCVPDTSE